MTVIWTWSWGTNAPPKPDCGMPNLVPGPPQAFQRRSCPRIPLESDRKPASDLASSMRGEMFRQWCAMARNPKPGLSGREDGERITAWLDWNWMGNRYLLPQLAKDRFYWTAGCD